jgi:peptidoglycan/LPS O-acetylase OafA/YrhL
VSAGAGTATPAPPATPAPRVDRLGGRDRRLDGLRALAALAVILTHAGDWTDSVTGPHALWIQELNVGVDVFFVISAVLLYAPFVASHLDGRPHPNLRTYAIRRITRIYPAYWVALVIILPLSPIFGLHGAWQWFSVPLLVHTYKLAGIASNAGLRQSWTLVIEISFYIFLPFYAFGVRRLGRAIGALRAELIAAIALFVAGPVFDLLSTRESPVQMPTAFKVLPPTLGVFAAGMLLAIAKQAMARRAVAPSWWRLVSASPIPWFVVAAVAYTAICHGLGISPTGHPPITLRQQFAELLLQTLVAICVVAPAVIVPADRRSWSLRVVASRPLAYIGMLSYGIYLWHYAVIEWLVRRLGCNPAGLTSCPASVHWSFVKVTVAAIPLSIAAGALSWYLVERPMIRFAHRYRRADLHHADRVPR